ncbi:DUF1796 family putative cysteine peptidase [Aeromonas veronii]
MEKDIKYFSLGENCLSDELLKRHNRKSISSLFSSGRSNIDYINQLDKIDYQGLINKENLYKTKYMGRDVVRSTLCKTMSPIFHSTCSNGFEFTHHDILNNIEHIDSVKRKIQRQLRVRDEEDSIVCFLYHHRRNKDSDFKLLNEKLEKFSLSYLKNKSRKVTVALFYQTVITEEQDRKLIVSIAKNSVITFNFHTTNFWEGNDPNIFWAKVDDDLIEKMFSIIDSLIGSYSRTEIK